MATGSSPPARQQPFKLILGSSSVARKHILEEMGLEFQVMTADIDEKSIRRENPDDLVMVLAEAKADAIMSRLNLADYQKEGNQPTLLITSDIVVVHEGIIREKPTTKEEARQFLKGLLSAKRLIHNVLMHLFIISESLSSPGYSGGHVSTVGSVVVTNLTTGKRLGSLDKAEVYFHDIPEEVIESLIDEGVVFRVAGGLLLEHPLTLPFVEAVVGSSDSVMGLSKEIANKLIHDALST
ncbi:maf-like protein DDB_G0281937 isoform X3 [Sorghum bicolor]|uniref:maf-like protein DDB_G0281937 isoform X3 n=1 Tax=Sorghum bicolor TaxID=4558 RepID=UPI000B425A83|nr:maf-like protein DDB_G0281937 isoform X3 [Sorghum bicolor]|eukprot:XP_021316461.1 maf-like protein DDB_G0281937 isoform X3 [Sorghum bicolor]